MRGAFPPNAKVVDPEEQSAPVYIRDEENAPVVEESNLSIEADAEVTRFLPAAGSGQNSQFPPSLSDQSVIDGASSAPTVEPAVDQSLLEWAESLKMNVSALPSNDQTQAAVSVSDLSETSADAPPDARQAADGGVQNEIPSTESDSLTTSSVLDFD